MKTLIVFLVLMGRSFAAPFLVCDQYPFQSETGLNIASFTIGGLPGSPITVPATIDPQSNGQYLHYDLATVSLQNGQVYTITAFATNVYGIPGAAATVIFTRGVPAPPSNFRISAQ